MIFFYQRKMPNANFESKKCTDREQNYFLKPFAGDGAETEHCASPLATISMVFNNHACFKFKMTVWENWRNDILQ